MLEAPDQESDVSRVGTKNASWTKRRNAPQDINKKRERKMELKVFRSRRTPNFYLITEPENVQVTAESHYRASPGDFLEPLSQELAAKVLRDMPPSDVLQPYIDVVGCYEHIAA